MKKGLGCKVAKKAIRAVKQAFKGKSKEFKKFQAMQKARGKKMQSRFK